MLRRLNEWPCGENPLKQDRDPFIANQLLTGEQKDISIAAHGRYGKAVCSSNQLNLFSSFEPCHGAAASEKDLMMIVGSSVEIEIEAVLVGEDKRGGAGGNSSDLFEFFSVRTFKMPNILAAKDILFFSPYFSCTKKMNPLFYNHDRGSSHVWNNGPFQTRFKRVNVRSAPEINAFK